MSKDSVSETVTAIIPTLSNTRGLQTLRQELQTAQIPLVVIDNSQNNRGFVGAVNLGAKKAKSEWLLILNDDVEGITRTSVNRLIKTAESHKWVAASPSLSKPDGKIENIGYRVLPIGKVELNFDPHKYSDQDLDGLTAACLLIRREIFEQMHGFDETFFAYLEDVDLFLRLKKAGYHFGVDTGIEVIHHHLTTSKNIRGFKEKQDLINWWRLILKFPSKFIFTPNLPLMLVERGRNLSGWFRINQQS